MIIVILCLLGIENAVYKKQHYMQLLQCHHNCLFVLFSGESALSIVIKKATEGLQGVEKQEATTEKYLF